MKNRFKRFDLTRKIKTAFLGGLFVLAGSTLSFGQQTLPYSEDFSAATGWTLSNGTQPNQWYIGNAGEATGNFLYISG